MTISQLLKYLYFFWAGLVEIFLNVFFFFVYPFKIGKLFVRTEIVFLFAFAFITSFMVHKCYVFINACMWLCARQNPPSPFFSSCIWNSFCRWMLVLEQGWTPAIFMCYWICLCICHGYVVKLWAVFMYCYSKHASLGNMMMLPREGRCNP